MAPEQKGCRHGSFGAKDQLLINKLHNKDCKTRHELEPGLGGLPESL